MDHNQLTFGKQTIGQQPKSILKVRSPKANERIPSRNTEERPSDVFQDIEVIDSLPTKFMQQMHAF